MKQIGLGQEKAEKRGHITLFQSKMGFALLDLPSCSRAASCHAKCDLTKTGGYPPPLVSSGQMSVQRTDPKEGRMDF